MRTKPDRGSATVQTAMWTVVLFAVALGGVQVTTYGWAYLASRHAADRAVQAARAEDATAATGTATAEQYIDQAADTVLLDPQVTVTRTPQTVTATVSGQPIQVIPLIPLPPVQVTASAPTERFRPITETFP